MRNRDLPRQGWQEFFESFSKRHRNQLTTVRVLGARLGAQVEARELPLEAAFLEARSDAIILVMGTPAGTHLEHPVPAPRRVQVELAESGAEVALEIESEGGLKTIVEFRTVLAAGAAADPTP